MEDVKISSQNREFHKPLDNPLVNTDSKRIKATPKGVAFIRLF